jgi:hypothetical protein
MNTLNYKVQILIIILLLCVNSAGIAQVGIGTTDPDTSAMLDITSSTKGMLVPRMTTVQKDAIVTPVSGLLVYDTTLGKFSYFTGSDWVNIDSNLRRDNYVLVKTLADFPTPSSGIITLVPGTMYEINGTILLGSNKIDINGCEIVGGDSNNDKLSFTGTGALFKSTKGGIFKDLSLVGIGAI